MIGSWKGFGILMKSGREGAVGGQIVGEGLEDVLQWEKRATYVCVTICLTINVNFCGGITFVWHAKVMTWGQGGVKRQRLARIWSENRSCSCPKNICNCWDLKCDLELVLIQIVCLVLGTFATRPTCISRRLVPCLSFSSSSGPRQKSPPPTGVPWV